MLPIPSIPISDVLRATLDRLTAAVRARIGPPGARVLIVPGLPGTMIGNRRPLVNDVVWFDPVAVAAGRLLELAVVPGAPQLQPLEASPIGYLQLKLRLQLAGHDVDTHPFDWRRPLEELGPELAARLAGEGRQVHLVAHSFGGLVCRAAIAAGATNVGKLITLGSPNHGTFTVVQGIRGVHWLLRALAEIDVQHSPDELAQRVFSTFPSVYEQLPTPACFSAVDLYDFAAWPALGPRPDEALLGRALAAQQSIADARGDFHVIAGYGTPTVDCVSLQDGLFQYGRTSDGDGWVPASLALLEDVPTYFTTSPHAAMTNDEQVIRAVEDLLAGDTTSSLPQSRPDGVRLPDESDATPANLSPSDVEEAIRQLLFIGATPVPPTTPT